MFAMFLIGSLFFHIFALTIISKRGREWLYSHQKVAFITILVMDALMMKFVGSSAEAGMANLVGGVIVELWILTMGWRMRSQGRRVEVKARRKFGIPIGLGLEEVSS